MGECRAAACRKRIMSLDAKAILTKAALKHFRPLDVQGCMNAKCVQNEVCRAIINRETKKRDKVMLS